MDLQEFKTKFHEINNRGFIKSIRRGPTGIGKTFETLIGIKENNLDLPDIKGIEIKTHRVNSNNLITLFTFNKKAWKIPPLEAVRKYGSYDKNNRLGLYYTMKLVPNSAGLFLYIEDSTISVRHVSGEIVASWGIENLVNQFKKKIPALLFVSAFTEERDGIEYFHYYRAQLMKGTTPDLLINQFKNENIVVDLRLHDQITRARNHGTGFRVYENKLPLFFNEITDL